VNSLLLRAIVAFLILPGIVAFLVPLLLLAPDARMSVRSSLGLAPLATGVVLLLACVREFYTTGRGTLAPWAPPHTLVTTGPYRISRNPMYVAVLLVLLGWALSFRSLTLAGYAGVVMIAFHLRVVLYEEPRLSRTHGDQWVLYKAQVPRWLGSHHRMRRAGTTAR
jgi:protein-S-isoprenylcysteine O-methyltransferase Ste14